MNLLENKVTLAVPEGNPKGIKSFDQLAELLKGVRSCSRWATVTFPSASTPRRSSTTTALTTAVADKLTYGNNVKEVTSQVSEAAADCGIIYATDAYSAGLTVVTAPPPRVRSGHLSRRRAQGRQGGRPRAPSSPISRPMPL